MYFCHDKNFLPVKTGLKNSQLVSLEYICYTYIIGMTKRQKVDKIDAKFQLRLKKIDLEKYRSKAAGLGVSLSEMILSSLEGVPVHDRWNMDGLNERVLKLTGEMNMIGKNINQVTVSIHQIKNFERIDSGEFRSFNELLQEYISKREDFKEAIDKIIF